MLSRVLWIFSMCLLVQCIIQTLPFPLSSPGKALNSLLNSQVVCCPTIHRINILRIPILIKNVCEPPGSVHTLLTLWNILCIIIVSYFPGWRTGSSEAKLWGIGQGSVPPQPQHFPFSFWLLVDLASLWPLLGKPKNPKSGICYHVWTPIQIWAEFS